MAQRVTRATIHVGHEVVGEMGTGLLVFVGVERKDDAGDAEEMVKKLIHLRVFPDAESRMNRSLLDTGGTLGVVSQFTLLGDTRRGRRPSYAEAAPAAEAEALVTAVVEGARAASVPVITGRFQADMDVSLVNRGPVTLLIDTNKRF